MKLNNKGFTMVELLATISIMAILSGVAISAVTRYQEKARDEAYKAMETSAFDAAQNYIQDKGIVVNGSKTIDVKTLYDTGYLPKLEDPRAKGADCHSGSTITVNKTKGSSGTLDKYTYTVTIVCKNHTSQRVECVKTSNVCSKLCSAESNKSICNKLSKEQNVSSCGAGYKQCLMSGVKFES